MISVDQAIEKILNEIKALPLETIRLDEALKRILAEDIFSDIDIPAYDNSSMDGYAVMAQDTRGACTRTPSCLNVVDEIRAGIITDKILQQKQAIRIMTGSVIPQKANAVVKVEDTQPFHEGVQTGPVVQVLREVKEGENIRRAGESVKAKDMVIKKGTRLNPAHIGMLASLGQTKIKVSQRPRVAILGTGDELIDIEDKQAKGKIRNANPYSLSAQIAQCGGIPQNKGVAKDNLKDLKERITSCLDCDVIITSGGVSMGEYDLVLKALKELGAEVIFWKVAVKPGKPLVFGLLQGKPVFGLPGNPVSGMVSIEIFVRPALLKMLGCTDEEFQAQEVEAILQEDLYEDEQRRTFMRAVTRWEQGKYMTRSTGPQGSGILHSMVQANSLIVFPEDKSILEKGSKVKIRFLRSLQ